MQQEGAAAFKEAESYPQLTSKKKNQWNAEDTAWRL